MEHPGNRRESDGRFHRPQRGQHRGGRREGGRPREYTVVARYGSLRYVGIFITRLGDIRRGIKVVVRTDRGTELGETLSESMEYEDGDRARSIGILQRCATSDDYRLKREIEEVKVKAEFKFCQQKIKDLQLSMKLADIEHLFGGDKIIFYFLADGRVDFRELVRELAREYRTRIEMKQIGVRDEAKLISDYEHCGRELCCRSFMKNLEPVTMRMAKNQKATLDPAKISGACGRLMCCLRFEDEVYSTLKRQLPKRGSIINYRGQEAEVIDHDIIQQKVRILVQGRNVETIHVSEIGKHPEPSAEPNDDYLDEKLAQKDDAEEKPEAPKESAERPEEAHRGEKQRNRGNRDRQ
jgi:cell fate regulator YaaT (PSP1 superfamily)